MQTIAYQGVQGAYSEQACKSAYPNHTPVACETFQEAMWLVEQGDADLAMIPLENSTAGRVEEIYRLIPKMALHVVAEHFEPVVHCLLGTQDAKIEDLTCVGSHPQALAQCHNNILALKLEAVAKLDTAGAAKDLGKLGDKCKGAIASKLAADIYGLKVLKEHFEDVQGNVTRFFVLSNENKIPAYHDKCTYVTSLIFQVRDIPASLYKALGGFATNGVNLLKLESYPLTGTLQASQFHIDLDGHPEESKLRLALEELAFFADDVRMLGTYETHTFRESFIH
ncbi:MAG TPA: prephenate dehydratase [Campylobacterales bacterium]|nr:prephenate dehydratase [Campylobacterales bacterium]